MRTRAMILGLAVLAACGPTREQQAQPMIEGPAGRNCTENGGKLVIKQGKGAQRGFCMLTDGRTLGIWEYYRQLHG